MTESVPRRSTWRIRWAQRENSRREQTYLAAIDAWGRRGADLRARWQAATSFAGLPDNGSLPVALRRGERIYLTLAGVQSVEAPHITALPALTWAEPSDAAAGPVPPGIRVRDHGTAVITNRRLLFLGPATNREWAYDKLTGRLDDPTAPMTLLHVSNRKLASGIVVQPAAAAGFRFNLQLAIADAAGQRSGLVAGLDQSIRDHERLRPAPPMLAEPGQAPARFAWSPLRVIAAGVAVFALLICVVGVFAPSPKVKPATRADPLAATGTSASRPAVAVATTRAPATSPTPTALSPTVLAPSALSPSALSPSARPPTVAAKPRTAHPATTRPSHKPTAKPSPKPKPLDFCGAPANPLGYTFCGGSLIRSPDPAVCDYFDCIAYFWHGVGYMEQCSDGTVSMSGGRQGSCSHHGGDRRPVYQR
jgi:hypothetical protein